MVNNFDNNHNIIANEGDRLIVETNLKAPNNRVIEVDFKKPTIENWKDIIPENENVLNAGSGGNKIFANYLVDVKIQVKQYDLKGKLEREIELPGMGTANGFGGKEGDKELYYSFTSFTYPLRFLNMILPVASQRFLKNLKSISILKITKPNKFSTIAKTEQKFQCSSLIKKALS